MVKKLSNRDFTGIYAKVPRLCVDLVLENKDRVLLTKRNIDPYRGKWHLPGGTVLMGESLHTAAKRIAKEELNLSIRPGRILGEIEFINKSKKYCHDVAVVVSAKKISGTIRLDNQASQYQFFRSMPKNTIKSYAIFVKSYLKNK